MRERCIPNSTYINKTKLCKHPLFPKTNLPLPVDHLISENSA